LQQAPDCRKYGQVGSGITLNGAAYALILPCNTYIVQLIVSMPATDHRQLLDHYESILRREGPAALAFLNARVPHRYSAVYRLADGVLHNLHVFDKKGEMVPEFLAAVPLGDSFCQFVLRDGMFQTVDTAHDQRLDGHRYQGAIGSYHGLPLLDNAGELSGTICHFDVDPHHMEDGEFAFFREAAKLLPRYLYKTPLRLP
jgi:hypothetical protein